MSSPTKAPVERRHHDLAEEAVDAGCVGYFTEIRAGMVDQFACPTCGADWIHTHDAQGQPEPSRGVVEHLEEQWSTVAGLKAALERIGRRPTLAVEQACAVPAPAVVTPEPTGGGKASEFIRRHAVAIEEFAGSSSQLMGLVVFLLELAEKDASKAEAGKAQAEGTVVARPEAEWAVDVEGGNK